MHMPAHPCAACVQGLRGTVEETFDVTTVMTMPKPQQAGATLTRELLETALDNISNCRCALFLLDRTLAAGFVEPSMSQASLSLLLLSFCFSVDCGYV